MGVDDGIAVEDLVELAAIEGEFEQLFPVGLAKRKILTALASMGTGPKSVKNTDNPTSALNDAQTFQPKNIDSTQELPEGKM